MSSNQQMINRWWTFMSKAPDPEDGWTSSNSLSSPPRTSPYCVSFLLMMSMIKSPLTYLEIDQMSSISLSSPRTSPYFVSFIRTDWRRIRSFLSIGVYVVLCIWIWAWTGHFFHWHHHFAINLRFTVKFKEFLVRNFLYIFESWQVTVSQSFKGLSQLSGVCLCFYAASILRTIPSLISLFRLKILKNWTFSN